MQFLYDYYYYRVSIVYLYTHAFNFLLIFNSRHITTHTQTHTHARHIIFLLAGSYKCCKQAPSTCKINCFPSISQHYTLQSRHSFRKSIIYWVNEWMTHVSKRIFSRSKTYRLDCWCHVMFQGHRNVSSVGSSCRCYLWSSSSRVVRRFRHDLRDERNRRCYCRSVRPVK